MVYIPVYTLNVSLFRFLPYLRACSLNSHMPASTEVLYVTHEIFAFYNHATTPPPAAKGKTTLISVLSISVV